MSIEATLICDECARLIVAAKTPGRARRENREQGGISKGGVDLCAACVPSRDPQPEDLSVPSDDGSARSAPGAA
jgi:hypothetical protein